LRKRNSRIAAVRKQIVSEPHPSDYTLKVAHLIAPAPFGGAETVVRALSAGRIRRAGPTQVVALLQNHSADPFVARLRADGVPVHEVRAGRRRYLAESRAVADLVDDMGAQVVHTHGYHADFVGYLACHGRDLPTLTTVHGFSGGDVKNRFYEWCDRRLLRRFDGVICVSERTRIQLGAAGASDHCVTVPNALAPLRVLTRTEARAALGLPPDGTVAGWIGRLTHEKAPELFVAALGAVQGPGQVRGVLIGDGPLRGSLTAAIAERGLEGRVVLAGPRDQAAEVLPAFDVLVMSSRREGMPMVLLEAMGAGVPAVCTGVGGIPELLDNETGWVVPPGDASVLAQTLEVALRDGRERRRRAAKARRVVQERFGVDRWLDGVEKVYRTVAEGRV
jgi:glycosyltransferase involved in cell wall biosynthesis